MSSEKRIFFIDGHAMVYRAHYAFINRPLMNSKVKMFQLSVALYEASGI
jgi:5'-3' exonuclease